MLLQNPAVWLRVPVYGGPLPALVLITSQAVGQQQTLGWDAHLPVADYLALWLRVSPWL